MKTQNTLPNKQVLSPVALSALAVAPILSAAESPQRSRMGVGMHSYGMRYSASAPAGIRFKDTLDLLEHCHKLGAGGVQASVGAKDAEFISTFRKKTEAYQMYFEGQLGLPRYEADVARFEK